MIGVLIFYILKRTFLSGGWFCFYKIQSMSTAVFKKNLVPSH